MPRPRDQNERIRDERRQDILRAARAVFAERGLAASKISDIAARAGLSHGLVYHYFRSKEAVYTAIIERAVRRALTDTEAALAREGSAWARLEFLTRRMLRAVREEPDSMLLITQAACLSIPSDAKCTIADYGIRTFHNLRALIREGQAAGEVRPGDPSELAYVFFATIQGLAISRALGRAKPRRLPRADTLLHTLAA